MVAAEGALPRPDHGRAGLTAKAAYREPFEPLARRRGLRAVRRRRRARGRRRRHDGGDPARADPGRGRRGRAARRLPRARPGGSPTSTARCSGSTRCRRGIGRTGDWFAFQQSTSAVRARRGDARQGSRRRHPDRRLRRVRARGRPARTRSARHDVRRQPARARPSRSPCSTSIEADGLLDHVQVRATGSRRRLARRTRRRRGPRHVACCIAARRSPSRRRRGSQPQRSRPA